MPSSVEALVRRQRGSELAESPVEVLTHLREHRLRLVLDDFGTGYSSLNYLSACRSMR